MLLFVRIPKYYCLCNIFSAIRTSEVKMRFTFLAYQVGSLTTCRHIHSSVNTYIGSAVLYVAVCMYVCVYVRLSPTLVRLRVVSLI